MIAVRLVPVLGAVTPGGARRCGSAVHGDQVIVTHVGPTGPVEVARHEVTTPGNPRLRRRPFPARTGRTAAAAPRWPPTPPRPSSWPSGPGAALWLTEAGAAGVRRVRAKMADAVALAKLCTAPRRSTGRWGTPRCTAASPTRPGLHRRPPARRIAGEAHQASEDHSLQPGTSAWEGFGQ